MGFDKIQHSLLTKTFSKLGIEAVHLSTIKPTHRKRKTQLTTYSTEKKLESFSSNSCIIIEVENRN